MDDFEFLVFARLFKEAYLKCFGHAIKSALTETESKIFCNKILDVTGLSIGWKSVKNYSFFVMGATYGKPENPSTATLDTLARYVLHAPYTTEIQRKDNEGHHPYWFLYREKSPVRVKKSIPPRWIAGVGVFAAGVILIVLSLVYFKHAVNSRDGQFSDNFSDVSDGSLQSKGWFVKSKDAAYWNKKGATPGQLTLFTLAGDNWPSPASQPKIKNLLLRAIPADCFTAEVHLKNFIPTQEWQQAGILLLEDTTFAGKSIRLSVSYNDDFGGLKLPHEILVQAITSLGQGFGKPEEIAHKPIFHIDSTGSNAMLTSNLQNSALRIEKHGNKFRFLYAGGTRENGAFKEVVTQEFDMQPKYIGIFAIKGFTNATNTPVSFKFFSLTANACD